MWAREASLPLLHPHTILGPSVTLGPPVRRTVNSCLLKCIFVKVYFFKCEVYLSRPRYQYHLALDSCFRHVFFNVYFVVVFLTSVFLSCIFQKCISQANIVVESSFPLGRPARRKDPPDCIISSRFQTRKKKKLLTSF